MHPAVTMVPDPDRCQAPYVAGAQQSAQPGDHAADVNGVMLRDLDDTNLGTSAPLTAPTPAALGPFFLAFSALKILEPVRRQIGVAHCGAPNKKGEHCCPPGRVVVFVGIRRREPRRSRTFGDPPPRSGYQRERTHIHANPDKWSRFPSAAGGTIRREERGCRPRLRS